MRAVAVPDTDRSAPEAVADLEALAAALDPRMLDGVLLGGAPEHLALHAPAGATAVARAACATETVPAAWVRALESVDAVWVPGEFSRAAFARSGVPSERLHVVAPVVDAERFTPGGRAEPTPGARGFTFLAPLDWTRASGWDLLLDAWAQEFGPDEDVTLVIRAWSTLGYTPQLVAEMLHHALDALGYDPAAIADLIVEVGDEHAALSPEAYRGAGCVVVPARGDAWGRTLLEAMACGRPLVATDWAAGSDLLPPGHPYALPATPADVPDAAARELAPLAGLRWAEPDVAQLRRLMRAAFADRAAGADAGARGREHVLRYHAQADAVAAPSAASAPSTRTGPSTAAAPSTPAARPAAAAAPSPGARPEDVSFVLQGPVERAGRARTAQVCAAIRAHFPGAEIVVSTWEGTDASSLDCDVVVHSADPGAVGPCTYNTNTNRQLVSSLAGVRASTRPLVAKVRSDMLFVSDALLSHWGRWEERADDLRIFERRVLAPNVFARRPSYLSPYPLHLSDWCFLGTRADLELLFGAPLMSAEQSRTDAELSPASRTFYTQEAPPSYTPEQWIWTHALRTAQPGAALAHVFDLTPETLRLTELSFANNVAILDTYTQFGVWCPKYPGPNRMFEDVTLYQHEHWLELYAIHCRGETGDAGEAGRLLRALGRGAIADATPADASRLRRAGHSWQAQLLDCVLAGSRLPRDSTTGGMHRWHLDKVAVDLARADLQRSAAAQVRAERRKSRSSAARPAPSRPRPTSVSR